jgi:3-mercaptopropionate dioxygenase
LDTSLTSPSSSNRNSVAVAGSAGNISSIADLVAATDALMDTTSDTATIVTAVQSQLAALLKIPNLLTEEQRLSSPDRYQSHVIAVAPRHHFSVVSLVWLPGQATPVHDHICWCVVGVLEGEEHEERFNLREDESGNRWLVPTVESYVLPGGVTSALVPPIENIHRVRNACQQLAISIHVYGADIKIYGSSINECFDGLPQLSDSKPGHPVAWRLTKPAK